MRFLKKKRIKTGSKQNSSKNVGITCNTDISFMLKMERKGSNSPSSKFSVFLNSSRHSRARGPNSLYATVGSFTKV
ncbi:unnamed protein product [Haemonchus placei]|uniref:Ovule protein n=1 Tax=Haemonchus placei TaxID=6290 RepID=A0A0N4WUZ1_HAEPC|nr:unnamed protein product [Haemonchus placei]